MPHGLKMHKKAHPLRNHAIRSLMLLFINVQRVAHLALMAVAFIYIVYVTANLFTSRQSPMYAIAALSMTSFLWLL